MQLMQPLWNGRRLSNDDGMRRGDYNVTFAVSGEWGYALGTWPVAGSVSRIGNDAGHASGVDVMAVEGGLAPWLCFAK